MNAEDGQKEVAPIGSIPMMMSSREMDTYELKTGPGAHETVNYKVFDRAYILDQVQQLGFMCPFHAHRKAIEKADTDQILIVADRDEKYGENWLLCITKAAFDAQMQVCRRADVVVRACIVLTETLGYRRSACCITRNGKESS